MGVYAVMMMTRPLDYCHGNLAWGPAGAEPVPPRPGLMGGAVIFTGLASTPGGSSGYGYLGMDITDAASWPRPYRPQAAAYYCMPPDGVQAGTVPTTRRAAR